MQPHTGDQPPIQDEERAFGKGEQEQMEAHGQEEEEGQGAEPGQEAQGQEGEEAQQGAGEEPQQAQGAEQGEESEHEQAEGKGEGERKEEKKAERVALFDGTPESKENWKKVGAGDFDFNDGQLKFRTARDRGLAYFSGKRFDDFRLKAQYRLDAPDAPVGVAFRFLDPTKPVPDREDSAKTYPYDNQAYVAAHTGFEVALGPGDHGAPGTFVGIAKGKEKGKQSCSQKAELRKDGWNELEVEARGNDFIVRLNGVETAKLTNDDEWRGKPASANADAGFVGVLLGDPTRKPQERRPATPRPSGGAVGHREGPELSIQRFEVETLGKLAAVSEERKEKARRDLAAIHEEARAELVRLKAKDKGLEGALKKAYGYAVVPSIGRASLVLAGARGYGEVLEQGKPIGFCRVTQLTIGVQVGGQTFTQLILFDSKDSLEAFKGSPIGFSGNLSVAFIRGASGMANFKSVTAHAYSRGGMLLEGSLGGQKFRFLREDEAIELLAKKGGKAHGAMERVKHAGGAAKGFMGKIASKVGGLFKRKGSSEKHESK